MKPVLYDINAFDPNKGTTLQFYWGGNQIGGNTVTIYKYDEEAMDYTVKYSYTYSSRTASNHPITTSTQKASLGILDVITSKSDFSYYATVKVNYTDSNGDSVTSEESDKVSFRCYNTPTFRLKTYDGKILDYGSAVRNSTVDIYADYYQDANEPINCFEIFLYNENNVLISQSGNIYNLSTAFTLDGLENKKRYYLTATGTTKYGTSLSVEETMIYVDYLAQDNNFTIKSENDSWNGIIHLNAYLNANVYTLATADDDCSLIQDGKADMTDNSITYDNSSGIGDYFQVYANIDNPNVNSRILTLYDTDNNKLCDVYYYEEDYPKYKENKVVSGDNTYYLPSSVSDVYTYGFYELDVLDVIIRTTPVLVSTNGEKSVTNWKIHIYRNGAFYNIKEEHS